LIIKERLDNVVALLIERESVHVEPR
jgi:hypothetical protein